MAPKASKINKAEEIRKAINELGVAARPKDIVKHVAEKLNIAVLPCQVSALLKEQREQMAKYTTTAASVSAQPTTTVSVTGQEKVSLTLVKELKMLMSKFKADTAKVRRALDLSELLTD